MKPQAENSPASAIATRFEAAGFRPPIRSLNSMTSTHASHLPSPLVHVRSVR